MKILTSFTLLLTFSLLSAEIRAQPTREWTVVASYTIPGKASGLAWDGTYLYSGLYSAPGDDNLVYRIDPSDGSYTLQCAGPMGEHQVTWDGCDEGGKICSAGLYIYRVKARKAHSTGTIIKM